MRGAACTVSSRSSLLLSCVGLVVARLGPRCCEGDRSPCFVRLGSSHTGFCVHRQPPDGLRLPGDPPIQQSGRAGSSTTRGRSPEAWHGLAGCPEASRLFCCLSAARLCCFSFPTIGYFLEGTNPTSRRVQRFARVGLDGHSSQLSSYVDGGCAVNSKPAIARGPLSYAAWPPRKLWQR